MKNHRGEPMSRFSVEFEVVNNEDLVKAKHGHLDPAKVRRKTIRGVVDSGAAELVLPQSIAKELGLPVMSKKVKVKYADGRRGLRAEVDEIRLFLLGRNGVFSAIVEPARESALVGAIVLEQLDLLVDCKKGRLMPRDPDNKLSEIE
jgi:predicted aspartyl protease